MNKDIMLSRLYRELADTLNISETKTNEIIQSYRAVGSYLGNMEQELDINIYPQGSLSLGTMVRPNKEDEEGDYDVDLVCLLKNGQYLTPEEMKSIVGQRLSESERYGSMLDEEGKRCWTLQYSDYHLDVLPCVPRTLQESTDTKIRLSHKDGDGSYSACFSNPKAYKEWFIEEMGTVFNQAREQYAAKKNVEIEEIKLFQLRTPLQIAIQILKRHRDIMFANKDNKPISIIITTLATKAYAGESDIFETISNIINKMDSHIEYDGDGNVLICNPTMREENFADKWKDIPEKKDAFHAWLHKARVDIIENPLNFADGMDSLMENMRATFGTKVVNETFEKYAEKAAAEREQERLGINNKGNIIARENKEAVVPLKNHTFYGGE